MIYFDHNATSPLSQIAREAWVQACERYPGNPSSPHRLGSRADHALNEAKQQVAGWLKCAPHDVIWTSGATESNNALFYHFSRTAPEGEVWVSAIEHPSLLLAARRWFGERVRCLPVSPTGALDFAALREGLAKTRPALVSVMAANNETGVLQPWNEVLQLCRAYQVPFACDAAQWVGKLPSAGLGGCDFVTGCAHKFGGPLGVGFIKAPAGFRAFFVGGEQEEGRRAGTENVPGILAMARSWEDREARLAAGEMPMRLKRRDDFAASLVQQIPDLVVLGADAGRLWNTVTVLMPPNLDCRRRWVVRLDKLGFAVSTGSACASGKEKPSHVLLAMGVDASATDRMLRFSAGWESTEQDWLALKEALVRLCKEA